MKSQTPAPPPLSLNFPILQVSTWFMDAPKEVTSLGFRHHAQKTQSLMLLYMLCIFLNHIEPLFLLTEAYKSNKHSFNTIPFCSRSVITLPNEGWSIYQLPNFMILSNALGYDNRSYSTNKKKRHH